jgi:phage tail-like protein
MLDFGASLSSFFTTCTGLGSESRADREEGHKSRPRVTFPDLVCTRGLTSSQDLWIWRKQVEQGEGARKDGMVTVIDTVGAPVAQWQVSQAWPRKLALGENFTEQVSLQYEEVTRVK